MENLGRAGGPVAELREVSTFPWDGVELVLLWIQVVRGPLLRTKIQSAGHVDQTQTDAAGVPVDALCDDG